MKLHASLNQVSQFGKLSQLLVKKPTYVWTYSGILRYDGPILRRKGDCYFVDVNVTGSVEGTSDKPKFALRSLFEKTVFPRISELVKPGREYAGYVPIIQVDNAGPHQDGDFFSFCKNCCSDNGWHWQPQAPQMPYMNNLDLAVFPSMSRRHNVLLRQSATNGEACCLLPTGAKQLGTTTDEIFMDPLR